MGHEPTEGGFRQAVAEALQGAGGDRDAAVRSLAASGRGDARVAAHFEASFAQWVEQRARLVLAPSPSGEGATCASLTVPVVTRIGKPSQG